MSQPLERRELTHKQQKEQALFEGMALVGIPERLHVVDGERNPGLQGVAPPSILDWANHIVQATKDGTGWNISGGYTSKDLFLLMARASYLHKINTRCVSLEQVIRWLDIYDDEEGRREILHTYTALFIKDFSNGEECLLSGRERYIASQLIRHRAEHGLVTHLHTVEPLARSQWWDADLKQLMTTRNRTLEP